MVLFEKDIVSSIIFIHIILSVFLVVVNHSQLIHWIVVAPSNVSEVRIERRAALTENVFVQVVVVCSTFLVRGDLLEPGEQINVCLGLLRCLNKFGAI